MEVLQLPEEQRGQRRVDDADEVSALALVHALVIARRVPIVSLLRAGQQSRSQPPDTILTQCFTAPSTHHLAQALNDLARLDRPLLGLGLLAELGQCRA